MFLFLAFGTVLPGIFETMELVLGLFEKFLPNGRIMSRPFQVTPANLRLQLGIGVLMLTLTLAFPSTCFCLAWGFAFFLAEPVCFWRGRGEKSQCGGEVCWGNLRRVIARG